MKGDLDLFDVLDKVRKFDPKKQKRSTIEGLRRAVKQYKINRYKELELIWETEQILDNKLRQL